MKTLCDPTGIRCSRDALKRLKYGVKRKAYSAEMVSGFPKRIWSITTDGMLLEARLENAGDGVYHGYPIDREMENDFHGRLRKVLKFA